MSATSRVRAFFQSPRVLRAAFWVARGVLPLPRLRGIQMVFRGSDVLDVLHGTTRFGVAANYAERMSRTTGPFFLGMEDTPQYRRERAFAEAATLPSDITRLSSFVRESASRALETARERGAFDLIEDYGRRIPLLLVQRFFGVPGPDDVTLARWLRTIFWDLFLNFSPGDPKVTQSAMVSAREMNAYLDTLIAEREHAIQRGDQKATFVDRLVQLRQGEFADLPPDAVRRNVAGVIVGAVDTISKAFAYAWEELAARPRVCAEARAAATRGEVDVVRGYVLEALRFRPHNPLVVRYALLDTHLAPGTSRRKSIGPGIPIFAWTLSASFDRNLFPRPRQFDPTRPPNAYLHFGDGLHRCFGERIAVLTVATLMTEALRAGSLIALGPRVDDGPFPDRWPMQFQPSPRSGFGG